MNHYDILGVPKNATAAHIKRAYRKMAMLHHPDKGGEAEKFSAVNKAYETLMDAGKRAYYDSTGTDQPMSQVETQAVNMVASAILQTIDQRDPDRINIIDIAGMTIESHSTQLETAIRNVEEQIEKRERTLKRIKGGIGHQVISSNLTNIKMKLTEMEEARKIISRARELIKDIKYTANAPSSTSEFVRAQNMYGLQVNPQYRY